MPNSRILFISYFLNKNKVQRLSKGYFYRPSRVNHKQYKTHLNLHYQGYDTLLKFHLVKLSCKLKGLLKTFQNIKRTNDGRS